MLPKSKAKDPSLWGIDNDKDVRRIQKLAFKKMRFSRAFWIACLTCGAVAGFIHALFLWIDFQPRWIRAGLAGIVGGYMSAHILVRHQKTLVASILKSEGRCQKCGYDLKQTADGPCPECGKPFCDS